MAAFFGLITMSLLAALAVSAPVHAPADFTAGAVEWSIATASMVLVFTPASNRFFRSRETVLI